MLLILSLALTLSTLRKIQPTVLDDLVKSASFPPVAPDIDGEPKGHLKPFGWQRPPEGPIKEYTEALNANNFWQQHVKDYIPLVYRGYLKNSTAIQNWDDAYLTSTYGDLDVLVEHKSEDRTSSSGRMVLRDFIKNYKDQDMYIVSMFPTAMMHEVRAIPSVLCGTFMNFTHESNLWMSSGGTRSVIHYDADHNLHCILRGRKDFILIENNITTKTNLYFKRRDPSAGSGYSFLDPDAIDMNKFKKIADVPWTYAELYPGDCIFIPAKYIHQVRGYGRNIAVTTLFTADVADNFNGDGCGDDILKEYHTMEEIPFQWTYKKGDATIDMGYMNVELVTQQFRDTLSDRSITKNGKLTKDKFIAVAGTFGPLGRNKTRVAEVWSKTFGFSDDYLFDVDTIGKLSLDQWKILCRAIEQPHGVVTNGTEPVFVRPGERHKWEEDHPEEDDSKYMTERERKLKEAAQRDPMLSHLSAEEKEEYLRKKPRRNGDDDDDGGNNDDYWRSEVTWGIEEVPKQYRKAIRAGKIPLDFKEKFMNSLSEVIKKRFLGDLEQNVIPLELVEELMEHRGTNADKKREIRSDDSIVPYDLMDAGIEKQRLLLQGKIPPEDIALFTKTFPNYREYFEKGVLPRKILMRMMHSDNEEDFEEDLQELQTIVLKKNRDEL